MEVYRAGKLSRKSKAGYRAYRAIEREVWHEWTRAGRPVPLALWHWYKWEEHRAGETAGQLTLWQDVGEVGSHLLLSPHLYY